MEPEQIRPKNLGMTAEAAQALGLSDVSADTDSAADEPQVINGIPVPDFDDDFGGVEEDPGAAIDAELRREFPPPPPPQAAEKKPVKAAPKSGPPNLDEWQDFFSRIAIRFACDWYITFAFRGIDEDIVSERDLKRLRLTPEERQEIARPFAEFANKSKLLRKHGRTIVATADSFESMVTLGMWFSRVNRIANKYRPQKERKNNVDSGSNESNGAGDQRRNITILSPNSG